MQGPGVLLLNFGQRVRSMPLAPSPGDRLHVDFLLLAPRRALRRSVDAASLPQASRHSAIGWFGCNSDRRAIAFSLRQAVAFDVLCHQAVGRQADRLIEVSRDGLR